MFNLSVVVNILAGSLIGSYFGARLAAHISERALRRMVVVLLVMLSLLLMSYELLGFGHESTEPIAENGLRISRGNRHWRRQQFARVAGGELIIPTFVLLFAVNIKLAGSLAHRPY